MGRTTVFGFYGTRLDAGDARRWEKWRPTVSLFQHPDLAIDRLELVTTDPVPDVFREDVGRLSPETEIVVHRIRLADPWDFEEVWAALYDLARARQAPEDEALLVHLTTGTHVAQICLFLLTEAGFLPGKLLQSGPGRANAPVGTWQVIDLDLARYDRIAERFAAARQASVQDLKAGIATRDPAYNALVARIEVVATASTAPILLTGPTGAGKSALARRVYELKRARRQLQGPLVEVNCATLRGDQVASTLFGHRRGAFTGATADRPGLLRTADGGLLFLDEIGELPLDEQAMLLRALEEKSFLPLGADREVTSDFQLVAGTNRDLRARVREGRFREDLLARLDLWSFRLPALRERLADLEPNLDHELARVEAATGRRTTMNREARRAFLGFATGPEGAWKANFRDLGGAVVRMATLAPGGRIGVPEVTEELGRLREAWADPGAVDRVARALGPAAAALDRFERVQLEDVLAVIASSRTASEAGRTLFAASRARKAAPNDGDRLAKYLARHGLAFEDLPHA